MYTGIFSIYIVCELRNSHCDDYGMKTILSNRDWCVVKILGGCDDWSTGQRKKAANGETIG